MSSSSAVKEVPNTTCVPPWNMVEQEENIPDMTMNNNPIARTQSNSVLCDTQKSVIFCVRLFAPFAVFSAPFAVAFPPFPARAAAYSFLMLCFCCHRERGLEEAL